MKIGFYGGKFLPMHKGHLYCIDTALKYCDKVVVIMFINGDDELKIIKKYNDEELKVSNREKQLSNLCKDLNSEYKNKIIEFHIIDVKNCKYENGEQNWDAEIPLVRQYVSKMDYVFSSETSYDEYFKKAYPEAKHILVDIERKKFPISSTLIRAMKNLEEKKKWMV